MSHNLVEVRQMFSTPAWRFRYPNFKYEREQLLSFLTRDEIYLSNEERNGLQITRASLHKEKELENVTKFILDSAQFAMSYMGYKKDCAITSLWATKQRAGGFHHQHVHRNSFLGGVFYVDDSEGNTVGTIFNNMDTAKLVIQPSRDPDRLPFFKAQEMMPFEAGTLVLFPAWVSHHTMPSRSQRRIVLATNIMPVGMTEDDHYDRYNYPDPSTMELKEYR